MTLSDELSKLSELRQSGTLSEDEFVRAKERLLNPQGPASGPPPTPAVNTFRRSRNDRWIAGVCGGIAQATGVESWVWRLFFTVLLLCGGAGLLVYFLLAIFVPNE
jgi:phage shock protein C